MKRLAGFWKQIAEGWTVQRIAAVLIVAGLAVFVAGVVNQACTRTGWSNLGETLNHVISDFYANVSVDCLSIAFAVLVIDQLNEQRAETERKAQLICDMAHPTDNGITTKAVQELRARGWLMDGSLVNANLRYANLEGSHIWEANLQGADFNMANFKGALIGGSNLQEALLINANFQGANLGKVNLERAEIGNTNLERANLQQANLRDAMLDWVKLKGAFLSQADFHGAEGLTDELLATVYDLHYATMCDGSRYDGRYCLYGDIELASCTTGQPIVPSSAGVGGCPNTFVSPSRLRAASRMGRGSMHRRPGLGASAAASARWTEHVECSWCSCQRTWRTTTRAWPTFSGSCRRGCRWHWSFGTRAGIRRRCSNCWSITVRPIV
jgi:hypothetical protein